MYDEIHELYKLAHLITKTLSYVASLSHRLAKIYEERFCGDEPSLVPASMLFGSSDKSDDEPERAIELARRIDENSDYLQLEADSIEMEMLAALYEGKLLLVDEITAFRKVDELCTKVQTLRRDVDELVEVYGDTLGDAEAEPLASVLKESLGSAENACVRILDAGKNLHFMAAEIASSAESLSQPSLDLDTIESACSQSVAVPRFDACFDVPMPFSSAARPKKGGLFGRVKDRITSAAARRKRSAIMPSLDTTPPPWPSKTATLVQRWIACSLRRCCRRRRCA